MNFLRRLFTKEERSLTELIENNSNTGIYRQQILYKIKSEKLLVGTTRSVAGEILDHSTTDVKCLTSTSPDKNGFVLLAFVNEASLYARNSKAFPLMVDISGIKTLIVESNLKGLVIISESGWVGFTTDELQA